MNRGRLPFAKKRLCFDSVGRRKDTHTHKGHNKSQALSRLMILLQQSAVTGTFKQNVGMKTPD